MKKSELAAEVAAEANVSKTAAKVVIDALMAVTRKHLQCDGEAALPGLGKLVTSERPARSGRNPSTGQPVVIAARTAVKFKPSTDLKAAVQ